MTHGGGIFLIQEDDTLIEMREQAYDSEALLQELLSRYPHLLAGDQIDSEAPRRWLLVGREMGVPGEQDGGSRWAADHLFLDQNGVPTIVEVKRSTDTRIRREVVGQMLDYAANAVVYWPVESIRARLESQCAAAATPLDDALCELLGPEPDCDAFWQTVKTNLQAGRVRLVFVADDIPAELRRVVEFLNTQMDPAEVLALEIRQYIGQGVRTLIPRVHGLTVEAQQRKAPSSGAKRRWDADSFFAELAKHVIPAEVRAARAILEWAQTRALRIWWGQGPKQGSFFPSVDYRGGHQQLIAVWTYGEVEFQFQHMTGEKPLGNETARAELVRRLRAVPGVDIPDDRLLKRPSIPLKVIADDATRAQFLSALDWAVDTVRNVSSST